MKPIQVVSANKGDFDELLTMSRRLWKNTPEDQIIKDLHTTLEAKNAEILIARQEEVAGFITVSIRTEYVEGCTSSPVGYIEAIYIKDQFRLEGIARSLVQAGEDWARQKGCTEMGSDTWLWNKEAQAFHLSVGYKEEDTLVHYIKRL